MERDCIKPQLESFFCPTIVEFLLHAAATTDENEPEYNSAQEMSIDDAFPSLPLAQASTIFPISSSQAMTLTPPNQAPLRLLTK